MKIYGWPRGFGLAASLFVTMNSGAAQNGRGPNLPEADVRCSQYLHACDLNVSSKRGFVREIEDAGSGAHWLLYRNESHPEKPGRLVLKRSGDNLDGTIAYGTESGWKSRHGSGTSRKLVIRTGDTLIVRERISQAYLQLEGVALGSAAAGDALDVRLSFFGRKVRAVAVQAGLSTLLAEHEVRP